MCWSSSVLFSSNHSTVIFFHRLVVMLLIALLPLVNHFSSRSLSFISQVSPVQKLCGGSVVSGLRPVSFAVCSDSGSKEVFFLPLLHSWPAFLSVRLTSFEKDGKTHGSSKSFAEVSARVLPNQHVQNSVVFSLNLRWMSLRHLYKVWLPNVKA